MEGECDPAVSLISSNPAVKPMYSCFSLLSDEDLVGLVLENRHSNAAPLASDAAYSTLVEKHEIAVRRVARSILGRSPDVDDAVQAAFTSAFRSLHSLTDRSKFKYWLRIIAANEARDMVSGSQPTSALDELMVLPERSMDRLPADYVEAAWLIDELTERLPDQYMKVLYLRYYLDYTVKEVAEMLGISPGLVKWRANRARRLAKEALFEQGGGNEHG